ncbi:MAG: DUF1800 family protein [Verrucomicrobiaceae bacterium]|nr:DUF1800 family protein [Verrucomicrobiaceae bacterium]
MRSHHARFLSLVASSILVATASHAGTDNFSTGPGQGTPDGLCDVWQMLYNGWGLVTTDDTDNDGCSNVIESIAGTDPRKPGDCLKIGNTVVSAGSVVFTFDAEKGKKYRVLSADLPNAPSLDWQPVAGSEKVPTADNPGETIVVTRPPGTKKFYKLEVSDQDLDNDGLSDWAEGKLGSDPTQSTSSGNASGGAASDADTLASLMSITITPGVVDAFEKEGTAATVRVQRSVGTMPLNITLNGLPGATAPTKASATTGEFVFKSMSNATTSTVTLPAGEGVSAPYEIAKVVPVQDGTEEVPEALKVAVALPGAAGASGGASATVSICDANPADPANKTLYVAFLGREAGAASTASGYATALVDGANNTASISVVFNNLSSDQNTAYIRIGPDLEVQVLPLGQVSGAAWNVRAAQTIPTDQRMLDALADGEVYVAITTVNFPDKEIWGYFNKAAGSEQFDPNRTDLAQPELGSMLWQNPTGEALEREIWRFMNQATMGGTTALYTEIRAKVDAAIAGGGTYLDGLENWIDEQMNPTLTPTLNYRKLVMAADMEEFALRGNKPITYSADPTQNGGTVGVTYVNGMPVANSGSPNTNDPGGNHPNNNGAAPNRRREWWGMVLQSKDHLRQRVTQALSEITVISERASDVAIWQYGTANWWDMLAAGAFGHYRDLLQNVTLNPMMGIYLTSMANRATYDAGGGIIISPDENYAREIMQLFSIGLVLRHPDGSLMLSSEGLPIATYDNNDITELARVFTGFSHGARHGTVRAGIMQGYGGTSTTDQRISPTVYANGSGNNVWFGRQDGHLYWQAPWTTPMVVIGRQGATVYHDFNAKTLFNGKHQQMPLTLTNITSMSDAQTHAAAFAEVVKAHDALAGVATDSTYPDYDPENLTPSRPGHTNTPVNMSRWLIQRLVTSNPSAGYIYRVQKAYRDSNGRLGNVVKAILLDYEARSLQLADTAVSHGKLKEPLIHFAHILRLFKAYSGAPVANLVNMNTGFSETDAPLSKLDAGELAKYNTHNLSPPAKPASWPDGPFRFRIDSLRNNLGQSPLDAPTVFNWFYPDFTVPGRLAQAGLFAPEMQTATEAAEVSKINHLYNYTWMTLGPMSATPGVGGADFIFRNGSATPAVRFSTNGGSSVMNWPATISLTDANWNTGIRVTMVGVNNQDYSPISYSGVRFAVTGSATGYNGVAVPPVPVTVVDNEQPNERLIVTETSSVTWVAESATAGTGTDTLRIRLSAPLIPGASVEVNLASANGEVTVSPATLTFTDADWGTNQIVTISAVDDSDVENAGEAGSNDRIVITTTSSTYAKYHALNTPDVPVNVCDNDGGMGVIITETGGTTDVAETGNTAVGQAGVGSYTIRLASAPIGGNVTVSITGNGVQINQHGTSTTFGTTYTRVFTPTSGQAVTVVSNVGNSGWDVPQTVVVRGNNDTTAEGPHWGRINHSITSTTGGYPTTLPVAQIATNIADDDDFIILTHTGSETRVMEGGLTDTIKVRLRRNPPTQVSVTLSAAQMSFSPSTIVFVPTGSSGNLWSTDVDVTVTANDDYLNEGVHEGLMSDSPPVNASASTTLTSGAVSAVTITNPGYGYTGIPSVSFGGAPTGGTTAVGYAKMTADGKLDSIILTNPGAGYVTAPSVTIGAAPSSPVIIRAFSQSTDTTTGGNATTGIAAPAFYATVLDNDDSRVVVAESGGSTTVSEDGTTDTYTLSLGRRPDAGTTTTVTLVPSSSGIQVSPAGPFSFDETNWSVPVTVTVTTTNDATAEPPGTATITHNVTSTDETYNRVNSPVVLVNVLDNDPALNVTQTNIFTTVREGGTTGTGGTPNVGDTFTVGLNGRNPAAGTTVTVTLVPNAQISVSPATVSFTSTDTATKTVTVTAVDDAVAESTPHNGFIGFNVASTDSYFNGAFVPPVTVYVTDNESPGVSIVESGGTTGTTEASTTTDSFTVVLTQAPTANVVLDFNGGTQSRLSTTSTVGTGTTAALTFTPANWATAQTLWTLPVDDSLAELRHLAPITVAVSSPDTSYASLSIPAVTHIITDNDNNVAPNRVRITESSGFTSVTESTATDTFTVVLSQQPTAPVTLTFTGDAEVSVSPSTLTFIPGATGSGTFNVAQTVTVRAVDDSIIEPAILHWGQVTATAASTDAAFDGIAITPVFSSVYDNDGVRISLAQSGGSTFTNENGVTDTYTVALSHAPAADVVITAAANSQLSLSPAVLTFTAANWATPQTVTITAVDDALVEAASHTGLITHSVASTDPLYHNASVATLTVPVWDNDGPSVDITPVGGTDTVVMEGGPHDSILIKLNTQPPAGTNVTLTLYPPMLYIPPPQIGKTAGYFTNDQGGSNQRDNIVIDYTDSILHYRSIFYSTLTTLFGGTIPANLATSTVASDLQKIQQAHWAASKAVVDQMDLWLNGGSLKARFPVLVEPHAPAPSPLPPVNPRQTIIEAVYAHSGGTNLPATTRYAPQAAYNPKTPPTATFDNDIRDRVRWCGYLMSVGAPGLISH